MVWSLTLQAIEGVTLVQCKYVFQQTITTITCMDMATWVQSVRYLLLLKHDLWFGNNPQLANMNVTLMVTWLQNGIV